MKDEKIVMYESDEAAQIKTLTGWVSREGIYWGDDEHMARYNGCTHSLCECGNITHRHYTHCTECRKKRSQERYEALPFREYKGEPVVLAFGDTYFFDEESIIEFCEDNEIEEVELLFCREQKWFEISGDYWADILPEDEEDLPDELQKALDNLNEVIKNLPPCSYYPGEERTIYRLEEGNERHYVGRKENR